jgi:hypothetical protein
VLARNLIEQIDFVARADNSFAHHLSVALVL